jgi:hypothetical protein
MALFGNNCYPIVPQTEARNKYEWRVFRPNEFVHPYWMNRTTFVMCLDLSRMLARLQNALTYAAAEVAYPEANDVNLSLGIPLTRIPPQVSVSIRLTSFAGVVASPGMSGKVHGDRTCVQIILERLQFAEDSGNQFRHRRMNVHGPLHHCVGGTRIHRV